MTQKPKWIRVKLPTGKNYRELRNLVDKYKLTGEEGEVDDEMVMQQEDEEEEYNIEQFEQFASEEQQSDFYAICHRHDASDDELAKAKVLLIESGAKDAVEAAIDDHRSSAEQRIEQLSINVESRALYHELVKRCLTREA